MFFIGSRVPNTTMSVHGYSVDSTPAFCLHGLRERQRGVTPTNHINVHVFAELIWSDGTAVTIRMSSHPVVCSCANINDGLINTELNNIRLGVSAPDPRMKYVQKNKASVHGELKRFR